MEKGLELYKEIIDKLVEMSSSCVDSKNVEKGNYPGSQSINTILKKLSQEEKAILSRYFFDCYNGAIYDVLDYMEWLQCCRGMEIFIEGEQLPSSEFAGFSHDFIGRKSGDWSWPRL